MTELPKRKRIRIPEYDYSTPGAYFITMCVNDRRPVFWNSVGANCVRQGNVPLSDIGRIVDSEIQKISTIYQHISVDKYCIMPDHIHMIVMIHVDEFGRPQNAPSISRIVKQFKGAITKKLGVSIWQKSFVDRVIRNEKGYLAVWEYIDNNPLKMDTAYDNIDFSEM